MKYLYFISLLLCSQLWAASYDYIISEGYYSDTFSLTNQSMFVEGGEIERVDASINSYIEMHGGTINSAWFLPGNNNFEFYSGTVQEITINGSCIANLKGGNINNIRLLNYQDVLITFTCDLNSIVKEYNEYGYLSNVSGKWLDGNNFNTDLTWFNNENLVSFVPEPTSIILLGVGGLFLNKKRI